jgi:DinB family protein
LVEVAAQGRLLAQRKIPMRTKHILATVVLTACSGGVFAQTSKIPPQHTVTETLDSWIARVEMLVVAGADAMPADKYSFAPPATYGDFAGVRTFAQQVKHLSANNYRMAALILLQKPAAEMENETGPESVKSKAEIMEYLKGSFAVLHKAVATIDAKNIVEPVPTPSSWQKTRLSFAEDVVAHDMDHFGQMVEYLRMNGIIPPESRPKNP